MSKVFQDRFEAEKFKENPRVLIGHVDSEIIKSTVREAPEEIVERLYFIGSAYKLHFCSIIDIFGDIKLNETQCTNFIMELDFVDSFVDDPLLKLVIADMRALAKECVALKGKVKLIISGN
ncbi:MAG TPA: hypothetical protein VFJ43_08195 [Bacteroidia bacterium]|nr:hypothetical protein [Bacteroidia bacterium]